MRYFLEVAYKGTKYAGFQVQQNANTIQAEVERALQICLRRIVKLTGASRTDAGVHAYQNYFHLDSEYELHDHYLYNLNSLLPPDIVVKTITKVAKDAHCRFDAISREYNYYIHSSKNPFLTDTAWFYPYTINLEALNEATTAIFKFTDFTSFSKRNTQNHTGHCSIMKSTWIKDNERLTYNVKSNRFLRGMVRGLVGTMIQVGRGQISISEFHAIVEAKNCTKANFSTPAKGLFLSIIEYPASILLSNTRLFEH
ncbi:MAG: tRNA pseudouridine(38-40) synthase TruA [Segetibacter sp.]|nr:tRNA pseudouridine(38-40) synthase TruA [Segetibacter sp.]